MNIRETVTIRSPNGKYEACAKFTIDEVTRPFTFFGATEEKEKYVFSAWVMAEEESTLNIEGKEIPVTTEWKRQKVSYVSSTNPLKIYFNKNGVYYFYQSQLEIGDVMTDWAPSPEDVEEAIKSANAKLELKVNKDTLKSEINALADTFTFTGNGFVVNAKNLTITEDGTIKATNGEFTGTIKGSSGEFTEGFAVRLDTGYSDGSTFDLLMEEDVESELKSFFVGCSGNDEMGQAGLWVSPGNVTIEGMNIKSYASRVYEISSNMQITLDAPEIYVQDSMYSGESFEMIETLSELKDSGWVDLTPTTGTWNYFRCRKYGKKVMIQGHASSYVWSGSNYHVITKTEIPEEFRTDAQLYFFASVSGKRIAKIGVTTAGNIFVDYVINISNGSDYTTSTWLNFTFEYYVK